MLGITDFLALVKAEGLQRTNRFHIAITLPEGVTAAYGELIQNMQFEQEGNLPPDDVKAAKKGKAGEITRTLSLMALDVGIPGHSVSTVDMHVGTTRKVAYDKSTGDLNVTFRCGGSMYEKKLFDAWRNFMFRPDHSVAYYDTYIAPTIEISTLDGNDNVSYKAYVTEAYPSIVTDLALNRGDADAFLEFQVTFNYRKLSNSLNSDAKKKQMPMTFGGNVIVPPPDVVIKATDFPKPPEVSNMPLFLIDIIKNIQRIQRQVENGTLSKAMGARLVASIIRDMNAAGLATGITGKLLEYANDVIFALGRFK